MLKKYLVFRLINAPSIPEFIVKIFNITLENRADDGVIEPSNTVQSFNHLLVELLSSKLGVSNRFTVLPVTSEI